MNYDITVNGRPWKIALEPAAEPGRFAVVIKGRRRAVDVAWIDRDTFSLIRIDADQAPASREVGLVRGKAGELDIALEGVVFRATVEKGVRPQKRDREGFSRAGKKNPPDPFSGPCSAETSQGARSITSPMPGRVVRVLVAAGDRVTAGQGVVIVEAMKMENELRSPNDGTVVEVRVAEGAAVEAGAVLVVVE